MRFGSKFVVKIPRERRSVQMPHLCPNILPYVKTLTLLELMSQHIIMATENTSAKAIASKVIGATVIKSLSIVLSLAFVSE